MTDLLDAARRLFSNRGHYATCPANLIRKWTRESENELTEAVITSIIDDLEEAYDAYEWSEEPPTEPGWYWSGPAVEVVYICRVWENDGALGVGGPDDVHPFEPIDEYHEEGWRWAGPIPEPTDPE